MEHYEIAAYGTLRAWAKTPGFDHLIELLTATLGEEEAADEKLTEIAEAAILSDTASGLCHVHAYQIMHAVHAISITLKKI